MLNRHQGHGDVDLYIAHNCAVSPLGEGSSRTEHKLIADWE